MDKQEQEKLYEEMAEKLGYPGSVACIDYLKVVISPEDGKLLLEFITPATVEEVAARLKTDQKELQEKIDELMGRGLLFRGKTQYVFQFGIHVFWNRFPHNKDEKIPEDYWRAWREFHPEELDRFAQLRTERAEAGGPAGSRVIPHILALEASPEVNKDDILWYENYPEILARGKVRGIVECPDRKEWQGCERTKWTCIYLDEGCDPDLDPKRDSRMKFFTPEEGRAYTEAMEKDGVMHLLPNNDFSQSLPHVLCNCCPCCCVVMGPALRSGRFRQFYSPSRYLAVVDKEKCTSCQTCVERCFFNAIDFRKTANSKKLKANVLAENCMGCGSCIVGCEQNAITFKLVRPPEHIQSQKAMAPMVMRGIFTYSTANLK